MRSDGEKRRRRWLGGLAVGALTLLAGLAVVATSGDLGARLRSPTAALRVPVGGLIPLVAASSTPTPPPATPTSAPTPAARVAGCAFALGFKALHDRLPDIVGDCAGDEAHDPGSGDASQATTRGVLHWRRADNLTSFTDGTITWADGRCGLRYRANGSPFAWEATAGPCDEPTRPQAGSIRAWGAAAPITHAGAQPALPAPRPAPAMTGVMRAAAGANHRLALDADGALWAWGDGEQGQLGLGRFADAPDPAPIVGITGVEAVAAGWWHTLALGSDGALWAWGDDIFGQLGIGFARPRYDCCLAAPVRFGGLLRVVAIAAGKDHSLALDADGTVWAWGDNDFGQLGLRTSGGLRPSPAHVPALDQVVAIAAGADYSLALKSDGTVWAWGDNGIGQLGVGVVGGVRDEPTRVPGLDGVMAIAAGTAHSLALRADGSVWAWGDAGDGRLGRATRGAAPGRVDCPSGMTAVAAGDAHSMALRADGTLWAWGSNRSGQLGGEAPDRLPHPMPARIQGPPPALAIAAGGDASLAIVAAP